MIASRASTPEPVHFCLRRPLSMARSGSLFYGGVGATLGALRELRHGGPKQLVVSKVRAVHPFQRPLKPPAPMGVPKGNLGGVPPVRTLYVAMILLATPPLRRSWWSSFDAPGPSGEMVQKKDAVCPPRTYPCTGEGVPGCLVAHAGCSGTPPAHAQCPRAGVGAGVWHDPPVLPRSLCAFRRRVLGGSPISL